MAGLTFDILKAAWERVKTDRIEDLRKLASMLTDPSGIYIRRIREDANYLTVEFNGIQTARPDRTQAVPQIKRAIITWLRHFRSDVQIMREGDTGTLLVRIRTQLRFGESMKVKMNEPPTLITKYERPLREGLTSLIRRRYLDE